MASHGEHGRARGYPRTTLTIHSVLRKDIKPYARALNLSFAHAISKNIPRNLRNRIYAHLLPSSSSRITVCDGKLPRHLRSPCNVTESHRSFWELPDLNHYFDPLYVGQLMAREMAEAHYSMSTFYFDYHDLYLIPKFLTVDRFGYGLSPKTLVRNVEIVLDTGPLCLCNGVALTYHGFASPGMASMDAIDWCLQRLFALRARAVRIKIIILLNLASPISSIRARLREFLRLVLPFARQLKALGVRFTLGLIDSVGREWNVDDTVEGGIHMVLRQVLEMKEPSHLLLHQRDF
jgi:hypothetical protein